MTQSQPVLHERREAIALVTLNEPKRRNAMSMALRQGLIDQVEDAMADPDIRVIVITGAGGTFCAGGDLTSMAGLTPVAGRDRLKSLHRLARRIVQGEKPVIAAVEGYAFGAGLSLAAACDQVVAARDAKFCASFNKVGLMADFGSLWTVPMRVGMGRAKRLLMLAEVVDGETAAAIGLADEVVEPGRALEAALDLAARFAAGAPLGHALTKAALSAGPQSFQDMLDREALSQGILFGSDDFAEGRAAFFEKRAARFQGR